MASEPVDKNSFMIDDFKALSSLTTDLIKATCRGIQDKVYLVRFVDMSELINTLIIINLKKVYLK